jgi:hypothetical protein
MKPDLALRLLGSLMKWDFFKANEEFKWLSLLVDYKYDHYQGYSPGARFLINLINWLKQFPAHEQREVAYKFIREKLIFINQREMHHLINLSMPIIDSEARRIVAKDLNLKFYETWSNPTAIKRLRLLKMRTLYVGLSDGARIDVFRRDNEGDVSNEQVVPSVEISLQKWKSLSKKLRERLDNEDFEKESALFERVCLIDDFTGSGSSLIRWEKDEWDGKVPDKFCKQCADNKVFGQSITDNVYIHIHHYLASEQASVSIKEALINFGKTLPDITFALTFSHVLNKNAVINDSNDADLVALIKGWYDNEIEDKHKGKNIWYGYKQCGLPLILDHNTPNNSIALLWAISPENSTCSTLMRPLFPRKQRHIDHGQPNAKSI